MNYVITNQQDLERVFSDKTINQIIEELNKSINDEIDIKYKELYFENSLKMIIRNITDTKKFLENCDEDVTTKTLTSFYNQKFLDLKLKYYDIFPKSFPEREFLLDTKNYISKREELWKLYNSTKNNISNLNKINTDDVNAINNNFDKNIFKDIDTYNKFLKYKETIIDFIPDYSYIFQKLLNLNLIHKKSHKEYKKWLYDNRFIKDFQLELFLNRGSFESLKNLDRGKRKKYFDNIFGVNEKD